MILTLIFNLNFIFFFTLDCVVEQRILGPAALKYRTFPVDLSVPFFIVMTCLHLAMVAVYNNLKHLHILIGMK